MKWSVDKLSRRHAPYLIAGILLFAVLLRLYRITDPFGGFHGFNDAFYASTARAYLNKPIIDLFINPIDVNNPPLLTLLLLIVFKIFGASEAAARMVPIASSALSIYYAYLLTSKLSNIRVSLIAAALLAVNPAFFLMSRNIQTDMLAVLLIMAFLYHYLEGVNSDRPIHKVIAGFFFGLALLAKLPAIMALIGVVVYEFIRNRNIKWLNGSFVLMTLISLLIASFWYGYQLISNRAAFVGSQSHLAGTMQAPNFDFIMSTLSELVWVFNPLVFILVCCGLVSISLKGDRKIFFVAVMALAFIVFYIFYHYHTYYLLPVVPFGIIASAAFLDSNLKDRTHLLVAVSSMVVISMFFTFLLMAGQKYGFTEFADLKTTISKDTIIHVDGYVTGNFGPLIDYYLPDNKRKEYNKKTFMTGGEKEVAIIVRPTDLPSDPERFGYYPLKTHTLRLVLFGISFRQSPPNLHQFTNGSLEGAVTDSPFTFGIKDVAKDSILCLVDPSKTRSTTIDLTQLGK